MQTIWDIKPRSTLNNAVDPTFSLSPLTRQILAMRSLTESDAIQQFLFPKSSNFHDPFLMKDMDLAVRRILSAIEKKELIMVHGDYDVDGITAASLVAKTLEKLGAAFYVFLPERKKDGYGISADAILTAKEKGVSVLITVDCGITAHAQLNQANVYGMDVIIIDHHQVHEGELPKACAILNPLQDGCFYPFKELSACGLAFKLSQALIGQFALSLLDLAALSTVCDIAPLIDENRLIVKFGLDLISQRKNQGLSELCEVSKIKSKKINSGHLGFMLGPRINACGRMSSAHRAYELLTSSDARQSRELARGLDDENKLRQSEEKSVLKLAIQQVEKEINFNRDHVIVVWGDGWHEGVIGIVAQRLVERFGRPSIVVAVGGERGKGSGRSVRGFHLFHAFEVCKDHLEAFGGHELAAGFSISRDKLKSFREAVNRFAEDLPRDIFIKRIPVDLEIALDDLTPAFLRELELFEPFGAGNPRPVFLTRNVSSKTLPAQVSPQTQRWWIRGDHSTFEVQWTRQQGDARTVPNTDRYDIVYSPKLKEWNGIESVVLDVKDVKARAQNL